MAADLRLADAATRPAELRLVDASALAALLFGEPEAGQVAERLQGHVLAAPHLIAVELASVCRKKAVARPEMAPQLTEALQRLPALGLRLVSVDAAAVAELAIRTGLTACDAAYVWLARLFGAELVTLDERLGHAAR
jgi:predicted nucleic acid-binding protein